MILPTYLRNRSQNPLPSFELRKGHVDGVWEDKIPPPEKGVLRFDLNPYSDHQIIELIIPADGFKRTRGCKQIGNTKLSTGVFGWVLLEHIYEQIELNPYTEFSGSTLKYTDSFLEKMEKSQPRFDIFNEKFWPEKTLNDEVNGGIYNGLKIKLTKEYLAMEIDRKQSAIAIRGYIDVLDQDNPYGAYKQFDSYSPETQTMLKNRSKKTPSKGNGYCYY